MIGSQGKMKKVDPLELGMEMCLLEIEVKK